mgnify:CR=1 FL=1
MKKEKIKNLMRYDNKLNKCNFGSLNTLEQNLLFAVICSMYGKTELVFDIEALRRFASGSNKPIRKDKISSLINHIYDTLFHGYVTERIGNEIVSVHLFRAINKIKDENDEIVGLKVIVDEMAIDIFKRKECNLTLADYDIFASIRSTYIKSIFRMLSQFKGTGLARFKYDEFLHSISCPKCYLQENIKARILEPAKKVIGDYFKNLDYELIKEYKLGRKVITKIEFTFDKIEYKKDIDEVFKSLELSGTDIQKLKKYNVAQSVLRSLDSSAEQAKIMSEVYKKKKKILDSKGFYQMMEGKREEKYEAKNDISRKLEMPYIKEYNENN